MYMLCVLSYFSMNSAMLTIDKSWINRNIGGALERNVNQSGYNNNAAMYFKQ